MARPQTVSFSQPLYVVALHLELATPSELRTPINPNLKAKGVKASTGLSSETNNPTAQKQVVIEPLCGWLLTLGHIFFEEHLKEPVLEVQWALGWMLVEAFKQRRHAEKPQPSAAPEPPVSRKRGLSWVSRPAETRTPAEALPEVESVHNDEEAIAMASRLTQFFALLPKIPGKHGAPMLSLALESVAESGLWRRGVLLPSNEDGQTRWLRIPAPGLAF
eukprot:s760_g7.t1